MYTEDDLLSISALQHLEFCPRRCALIHIEGMWMENAQTAEGRVLHQRVHQTAVDNVEGLRTARGLRLCSLELGLYGVADVVEFHRLPDASSPRPLGEGQGARAVGPAVPTNLQSVCGEGRGVGCTLPNTPGRWQPYPVEY